MENALTAVKDCANKVKEFVEENRQLVLVVAGVLAAIAAVCVAIKLLRCRK